MGRYRYTGDDERYYPDLGLTVKPGGTYDLAKAPDARFVKVKAAQSTPRRRKATPEPPPEPVTPEETS